MITCFYFSLSILLAPWTRINFDIEVSNVWAIWLEGSGGMWGSFFFLGFGREVGQEVNVILGKCMGEGVKMVNFFSIDCERSTVHIYISARGLKKQFFFFFFGVLFCTSSKGMFFAFFFWLSWDHRLFQFGFFPIFLSSFFFFYFFFDF